MNEYGELRVARGEPNLAKSYNGGPRKFSLCLNSGGLREKREDEIVQKKTILGEKGE